MTPENTELLEMITHPKLTTTLDNLTIPQNSLALYHTNLNSLTHKHSLLQKHMNRFIDSTPHIVTITDTHIKEIKHDTGIDTHYANSFPLDGYKHKHRQDVTVYWRIDLDDRISIPEYTFDIERAAANIIQIHSTSQKTHPIHTIISMYRRPKTDKKFIPALQRLITQILTDHPLTIIHLQGDLNLNLQALTHNNDFAIFILENNLRTTITTPTRYDFYYKSASLIDINLTAATSTITAGTLAPALSDHLPTLTIHHKCSTNTQKKRPKTLSNSAYQKDKTNILEKAQEDITTAREEIDENTTESEDLAIIQQSLQATVEHYEKVPRRRKKPWCSLRIRKMIRRQHVLHKRALRKPSTRNIQAHRAYRRDLNKTIKTARRTDLMRKLQKTKGDHRKQAQVLQSVIPDKSKPRTSPEYIEYEGKTYTDPQQIADIFNNHYITIGHKTSLTIPKTARIDRQPIPADLPPVFELKTTTIDIVTKLMKKIKAYKASDIYKIKPALIKDLTPFLAPILTELFNKAIRNNNYPDSLKFTKVIEVYKKKDKKFPVNYRPISLLPIIAKVLDTLINKQLMTHLTKHDIISPTQYAFRPNSNTAMAVQAVLNRIHRHKQDKHPTLAIYIDLSKAYDTVSHEKLIHKLKHTFNFADSTVAFFASYFKNRTQTTHTQHAQSAVQTITHGIPQGSTLSTTLFLLYINDIIKTVPLSTVYTYADDTTLIITAPSTQKLQKLAQSELDSLISYFHENNLVPNASKTLYTIFYPRTAEDDIALTVNIPTENEPTTTLEHQTDAPLLGVIIQKNLKHHRTVNKIMHKLYPITQALKHAAKLLPLRMMVEQYYEHVYPHLIYAISVWGTEDRTTSYIQPLIRVHKRIVRILSRQSPRAHTGPIMQRLKILNINKLYKLRVCAEMHPFIHPKKDLNRPEHAHHYTAVADTHTHATRYATNGAKFRAQNQDYFTEKYIAMWNSVPDNIQATKSYKCFTKVLLAHLLEKQNDN